MNRITNHVANACLILAIDLVKYKSVVCICDGKPVERSISDVQNLHPLVVRP